jgi:hypothetical protein
VHIRLQAKSFEERLGLVEKLEWIGQYRVNPDPCSLEVEIRKHWKAGDQMPMQTEEKLTT